MSSVVVDAVELASGVHRHRPQGQSSVALSGESVGGGMAAGAAVAHPLEQPTLGSARSFSTMYHANVHTTRATRRYYYHKIRASSLRKNEDIFSLVASTRSHTLHRFRYAQLRYARAVVEYLGIPSTCSLVYVHTVHTSCIEYRPYTLESCRNSYFTIHDIDVDQRGRSLAY